MAGIVEQLDEQIANLLSGYNVYTTVLLVGVLGFIGWVVYDTSDADTHPLLLARQAQASYVRNPGESAVYRSPETPHGCKFGSEQLLRRIAEYMQMPYELVYPLSLRARPCILLARMATFEIFGDVSQARFRWRRLSQAAQARS